MDGELIGIKVRLDPPKAEVTDTESE